MTVVHAPNSMETPWGIADQRTQIAPGIIWFQTPSHGGAFLEAAQNALVPDNMRCAGGWYEHHVDWAIPALVFPAAFPDKAERAEEILRNWRPEAWEAWTGKTLNPGQSFLRDRKAFLEDNANRQIVTAAWGDWLNGVPKGQVLVIAHRGGRDLDGGLAPETASWHLVDANEYAARRSLFVIPQDYPTTEIRA